MSSIKFVFIATVLCVLSVVNARLAGECAMICNDLRTEVLTLAMCKDAKRTLPRPKVGDFCSIAMEQGFSDACVALCMEQVPTSRVAQSCRAAAIEMPRPTVRKWCEHGYNTAFSKTKQDLKNHFSVTVKTETVKEPEPEVVEPAVVVEDKAISFTIPIHLEDKEMDLYVYEGQSAEDAVVAFCQKNVQDDVAACIRQLIPIVMERIESESTPKEV